MKKYFLCFFALGLLFSFNTPIAVSQSDTQEVQDGQIVVTRIKKSVSGNKQQVEIILNGAIKIREIEVTKISNRTVVKYPVYVSKAGRSYPQIRVLTKQANDAIIQAIETGKFTKEKNLPEPSFEITKFSPNRLATSSRKVFCAVTFNKAIEIECGIMDGISKRTGKPYKFVSWPSRRDEASGEYVNQVILKPSFKIKVEDALLKRYDTFKKEGGGTSSDDEW